MSGKIKYTKENMSKMWTIHKDNGVWWWYVRFCVLFGGLMTFFATLATKDIRNLKQQKSVATYRYNQATKNRDAGKMLMFSDEIKSYDKDIADSRFLAIFGWLAVTFMLGYGVKLRMMFRDLNIQRFNAMDALKKTDATEADMIRAFQLIGHDLLMDLAAQDREYVKYLLSYEFLKNGKQISQDVVLAFDAIMLGHLKSYPADIEKLREIFHERGWKIDINLYQTCRRRAAIDRQKTL